MEVHHLLLITWFIVFAFWLGGQFKKSNRKYDQKRKTTDA